MDVRYQLSPVNFLSESSPLRHGDKDEDNSRKNVNKYQNMLILIKLKQGYDT